MKTCEKCKTAMDENSNVCPKCGQRQSKSGASAAAGENSSAKNVSEPASVSEKPAKINKSDKVLLIVICCVIAAIVLSVWLGYRAFKAYFNRAMIRSGIDVSRIGVQGSGDFMSNIDASKMSDADREKMKKEYDDRIAQLDAALAESKKTMEESYEYLPADIKNADFTDERQKAEKIGKLLVDIGSKMSSGNALTQDEQNQYSAAKAYMAYYANVKTKENYDNIAKTLANLDKQLKEEPSN
ncbi:MAG: zinc ribbon domain-containing protein [Endomicrobia bacterium]|nr:zinc ribbon domain-containing protein [Endomicrobiia bacterium]